MTNFRFFWHKYSFDPCLFTKTSPHEFFSAYWVVDDNRDYS